MIATDVERSSGRNDALLVRMRRDLREILSETLERQGLDPARLTRIDEGDGYRYLIPADVAPPHAALDPFVARLGIELRMHRESASEANRLRLRVAVHSGLLYAEPGGSYTGVPLKDCARLLDADAGRELLAGHPEADLVLLLTDSFYRDVVGSGTSLDPDAFRPIRIAVKETDRAGWAYLPNVAPHASAPAPSRPPAGSGVWIAGDRNTFHGPIVGRDYHG
jgi:class 3 adenylate cyclase